MQMKTLVPVLQELLPEGNCFQAWVFSDPVTLCLGRGVHQHWGLYRVGLK